MNRTYIVAAVIVSVLCIAVLNAQGVYPPVVSSWLRTAKVNLYIYANIRNPEVMGIRYAVRLNVPYRTGMNNDFSDLRFGYDASLLSMNIVSYSQSSATVDVFVDFGSGEHSIDMYFGNPEAKYMIYTPYQRIGWSATSGTVNFKTSSIDGVETRGVTGFFSGVKGIHNIWFYSPSSGYVNVSFMVSGYSTPSVRLRLYSAVLYPWDFDFGSAFDYYPYTNEYIEATYTTSSNSGYYIFNLDSGGWYTISILASKPDTTNAYDLLPAITKIELLDSNFNVIASYGNAAKCDLIDNQRCWLLPILHDSRYYSYSISSDVPVVTVAPLSPTAVFNTVLGNQYYELGYVYRTVTVTLPTTVTVTTSIPIAVGPTSTYTYTVVIPVTTTTMFVAAPAATYTFTRTVTITQFTAIPSTLPVTITTTLPVTMTTTSPVTITTTSIGGTPVRTTTITTTTEIVTTTVIYSATTITSPWKITVYSPIDTVTTTITTTIPVETTVYANVAMPIFATGTVTVTNTGTSTVTTTVNVTAVGNDQVGVFYFEEPYGINVYGGVTTTTEVYWIARTVTSTVTATTGAVSYGVDVWLYVAVFVMIVVLAIAIIVLARKMKF